MMIGCDKYIPYDSLSNGIQYRQDNKRFINESLVENIYKHVHDRSTIRV